MAAGADTSIELTVPSDIRPAEWVNAFESQVDFADLEESHVAAAAAVGDDTQLKASDPLLQSGDLVLGEFPLLPPPSRPDSKIDPLSILIDSGEHPFLPADTDPSLIVPAPAAAPPAPPPAPMPTAVEQAKRLDGQVAMNRTAADLRRSLADQRSALADERAKVAHELATVHLRIEHAVEGAIATARANMEREREDIARDREDLEDDRLALDEDREAFQRDRETLNGLLAELGAERAELIAKIREEVQAETESEMAAHAQRIPTTDFGQVGDESPENEPTQSAVIRKGKRKTGSSARVAKSEDESSSGRSRKKPTAPRRRRRRRF